MSYQFEASIVRATPAQVRSILNDTQARTVVTLPLREEWSVVFLPPESESLDQQQAFADAQQALLTGGGRLVTVCWNDQVGIRQALLYTPGKDTPRSAGLKAGFNHVGLPRDMQIHELISIVCHGEDITPFSLLSASQRQKRFIHVLATLETWVAWGTLGSGAQQHFTSLGGYQATRKYMRIQFQTWRHEAATFTPEQLPHVISHAIAEHMTAAECSEFIRHKVAADLDTYFTRMYADDLHEHG